MSQLSAPQANNLNNEINPTKTLPKINTSLTEN